jgi:hypothetical protein
MQSQVILTLIFGLLAAFGTMARAEECFCLTNPQTAAILRGCESFNPSKDKQIAACADPITGQKAIQTMSADWQRIEAGTDRCNPCKRVVRATAPELPRGGSGDEVVGAPK